MPALIATGRCVSREGAFCHFQNCHRRSYQKSCSQNQFLVYYVLHTTNSRLFLFDCIKFHVYMIACLVYLRKRSYTHNENIQHSGDSSSVAWHWRDLFSNARSWSFPVSIKYQQSSISTVSVSRLGIRDSPNCLPWSYCKSVLCGDDCVAGL